MAFLCKPELGPLFPFKNPKRLHQFGKGIPSLKLTAKASENQWLQDELNVLFGILAGAWSGAIWSWGYLKSLHNRELRNYPQVSKHILGCVGFKLE